jgi:transcriptional regulator with XRE-family HTH domain
MPETFGARLRRRREEQNVALSTIAEQTKIKLTLLAGLERDDVSHWPSGIFRRAFVRAYAHAIGLDPDVVVRDFLEVHPDPVEQAALDAQAAADAGRNHDGPQTRLRHIVGSALGSLRLRRAAAGDEQAFVVTAPVEAKPVVGTAPVVDTTPIVEAMPVVQATPVVPATPTAEAKEVAHPDPDFVAVAHLCTELGRVETASDMQPLLPEAARVLNATGLIVWMWDGLAAALRPALAYGYSDRVLAQLPAVSRNANNATAAAFRSAKLCAINGSDHGPGALAIPLLTPAGCAGVLALELERGHTQSEPVRAAATILAAVLAQLVGGSSAEVEHLEGDTLVARPV